MTASVAALADADYTIPTVIYNDKRDRLQRKSNQYLFHGAWSFRREAFERVNGYPFIQSGQDQGLLRRFKSAKLRRADPIQHDSRPSYVYRWFTAHSTHISAMRWVKTDDRPSGIVRTIGHPGSLKREPAVSWFPSDRSCNWR